MAKWAARDVKCPFFKNLTERQISCEGVDDKSTIRLTFETKEGRQEYQKRYCNSVKKYSNCLIAQMLMGKYRK